MKVFEYGSPDARTVLIQPVDDHDLGMIEREIAGLRRLTACEFRLLACKADDWNNDLSPWAAPAVFGKQGFGGGAEETLAEILKLTRDKTREYFIGGYSLAGLFALWAVYQTEAFYGAAAASPSVWFPGFTDYMRGRQPKCAAVYLSLGDRESKTRNPVMASVADRISEAQAILAESGVDCVLEWNEGNHFKDADIRTAKAFAGLLKGRGER